MSSPKYFILPSFTPYLDSAQIGPPIANSLRGYPVIGQAMQIPPTHVGLVFQEDKQPLDEDAQRTFQQKCSFSRFTYWNYDQNPSANDTLRKAVENLGMIDEVSEGERIITETRF